MAKVQVDRESLTDEEAIKEAERKAELLSRFKGNIHSGGRPKSHATVIREMMEGEFASVTEKNIKGIAQKLIEMVESEDKFERQFAIKTLMENNHKIIDREIAEKKSGGNEQQLIVNVNRGSVEISRGKDKVKIDTTLDDDRRNIETIKEVKEIIENDPVPQDLIDAFGEEEAADIWYNSEEA